MNEVRLGIIGCGGMAQSHMDVIKDIPRYRFVAASDTFAENLGKVVTKHGVKGFADGNELIRSGEVDAVLIATPHYFHPIYAIEAMKHGLHVLTEKPVAVTAKAAAEVNKLHAKHPKLVYAAMFQMRTVPKWKKAKEIIASGQLGEIKRVLWNITTWFRTQAYYDSGSWRATWAGEGGGVLLNQCPHNLDMLYWLTGQPKRVHAHLGLGKYHKIEVEDDVTAYFEYTNGATGVFITSTGESPGSDYFEIVGDRGRLLLSGKNLELVQTDVSVQEFLRTTKAMWAAPGNSKMTIEVPDGGNHKTIHENFAKAILDGEPVIAPGDDGLYSVEVSNAIIQSGLTKKTVELPMDREGYDKMLQKLIKGSKKKV